MNQPNNEQHRAGRGQTNPPPPPPPPPPSVGNDNSPSLNSSYLPPQFPQPLFPQGFPQPPSEPPSAKFSRKTLIAGLAAVLVVAAAFAAIAGYLVISPSGSDTKSATAAPSSAAPQSVVRSTSATTPSTSASPSATTFALPAGAQGCPSIHPSINGYSVSAIGTLITSCPFAEEVRVAYASSGSPKQPRLVTAFSPITKLPYVMNCVYSVQFMTCTGGNDAVVYVY